MMTKPSRPSPIGYQRLAAKWLDKVRSSGAQDALRPAWHEWDFDILGALRAPINVANGAVLRAIDVIREDPADSVSSDEGFRLALETLEVAPETARQLLGDALDATTLQAWRRRRFRERLYTIKSAVLRTAAQARRAPAAIRAPIIFLVTEPINASQLAPVAGVLRDVHRIECAFCTTRESLHEPLRRAGFETVDLFRWSAAASALAGLAALRGDAGARLDNDDASVPERALAESTARVLTRMLPDLFRTQSGVARMLERSRPRLLVIDNPYSPTGRVAAQAARALGIATAAVEHGTVFERDPRWAECDIDLIAAWSESSRATLLANGIPAERVVVTGAPHLDAVEAAEHTPRRADGMLSVLVATSGAGDSVALDEHRRFIHLLREAVGAAQATNWTIKLHRKDRIELYREAGLVEPSNVSIAPSSAEALEIFRLLDRADVVVTVSSSAGQDALMLGVPVIAVTLGARDGPAYLRSGCTIDVDSADGLVAALDIVRANAIPDTVRTAMQRFRSEHPLGGDACGATAAAFARLASGQSAR
jgi:hypothetical protein